VVSAVVVGGAVVSVVAVVAGAVVAVVGDGATVTVGRVSTVSVVVLVVVEALDDRTVDAVVVESSDTGTLDVVGVTLALLSERALPNRNAPTANVMMSAAMSRVATA
jgi:hypothetical protein